MRKLALLSLTLAACTHDLDVFDRVDVQPARDLDILYVFDNTIDRAQYDTMASQLDVLQSRLASVDGQLPSLHVGLVTTDLGTRGALDLVPQPSVGNCNAEGQMGQLRRFGAEPGAPAYLEDLRGPDGARVRNFASGDLRAELAKLTNPAAGTQNNGCEFEQPLEAMRRALAPDTNPGFVRPGAQLAVVFLTNEDDCSLKFGSLTSADTDTLGPWSSFRCTEYGVVCDEPDPRAPGVRTNCRPREDSPFLVNVSEYQTFLEGVKPDKADISVSAVAGARTPVEVRDLGGPTLLPSCQGPSGTAKPAIRIGALVDAFGGALVDSCTQTAAYDQIAGPILAPQRACFPNLRQADGDDCEVLEIAGEASNALPPCGDGTTGACWSLYTDAAACPGGDNVGISITRGATPAPANARIQARCFVK